MIVNDSARIGADIDTASIQGGHKGIRAVTGAGSAAVRVLSRDCEEMGQRRPQGPCAGRYNPATNVGR
jgi:hypothetical protein